MSATLVTAAAAGWYHDPSDSDAWRWWDGATWTSHVRPKEQTTPVAIAYPVSEAITLPVSSPVQSAPGPQQFVDPQTTGPQPVNGPATTGPQAVAAPQAAAPQSTGPEPVAAPQTAAPQIPQPAQPIAPIQPVSLTPETPASEQEYWHSPNAEVVQIPGRSATSHGSHFPGVGPSGRAPSAYDLSHAWGDVGSPHTAGIWLLAFLPIISIALLRVMGFAFQAIIGPSGALLDPIGASQTALTIGIAYIIVMVLLAWVFAGRDIKMLKARGYKAPSIWWMLVPLSPLAYFIARGKVVRAEGKRAWPPELLFFLSIVVPFVLSLLAAVFAASILGSLTGVSTL